MPDASTDRAIGRIEGKIDSILDDQKAAANSRKATYEKMETIIRKADETDRKVDSIDRRLEAAEKAAAEFSKWRERAVGAGLLISFVGAAVGGGIALLWSNFLAWLKG